MPDNESPEEKQKNVATAWAFKGWFLFILGKLEAARKCCDKAIELDPTNLYGWSGKFWTYFNLGKVAEFIEFTSYYLPLLQKGKMYIVCKKIRKISACKVIFISYYIQQQGHICSAV